MKITVIGTGYVGLVTGGCFAEVGHTVYCVDIDEQKISGLKQGKLPIYEPGLDKIIETNYKEGRLHFTTSLADAIEKSSILFISVGTPPDEDGSADLQHVLSVARSIGTYMNEYTVVITKSTVPVGTAQKVRNAIEAELHARGLKTPFDMVSNPEFLKEGAAVEDFMRPDRIVIGCESERAKEIMHELYSPFTRIHQRIYFMTIKEAEMTKYAANAMLACKISFMNEIAIMCEKLGVDVENIRLGIGSDPRIGYAFIYPGCGYGGSCFPKDVKALIRTAEENGMSPSILNAVEQRNNEQKKVLYDKAAGRFGPDMSGKVFGVWGLAFKPGTDDIREAPSVVLIKSLIDAGARVKAYDPAASETIKSEFESSYFDGYKLDITQHQYDALKDIDALFLVTEWKPFRYPDFAAMRKMMKTPIIFDGRNQYDPKTLRQEGFEYYGIGR